MTAFGKYLLVSLHVLNHLIPLNKHETQCALQHIGFIRDVCNQHIGFITYVKSSPVQSGISNNCITVKLVIGMYRISSVLRRSFFSFQNNIKDLDPS